MANKSLILTARGKTQTLKEWAKEVGRPADTIRDRMSRGMSVEDAIFAPWGTSAAGKAVRKRGGSQKRRLSTWGKFTSGENFNIADVARSFSLSQQRAGMLCAEWHRNGILERVTRGVYVKAQACRLIVDDGPKESGEPNREALNRRLSGCGVPLYAASVECLSQEFIDGCVA